LSIPLDLSASQAWDAALAHLLLNVTKQNYETWLRNTVGLRFEDSALVIGTPSRLARDWLAGRMSVVIAQALSATVGQGIRARFEASEEAEGAQPLQPSLLPQQAQALNPRFMFSSYLEGDFNQLAVTAARQLVDGADLSYSPLFVTGHTGMGKTHLLHATAHLCQGDCRLLLANADQFLGEFTTSVRNHSGSAFRARYRDVDFLLIDDVHLLTSKRATLKELHQTIWSLRDLGKRVIVAGDLGQMTGDGEKFRNQLAWGLVAPLEPPSTEDRVRFVREKATRQRMDLPEEVEHYLALRVRSSLRDLEGAVNRVCALARISREPLTIDFAARALQPVAADPLGDRTRTQPADVVRAVCNHLCLGPAELVSARRDRNLTYGRHIAMYLLRQEGGLTYNAIAQLMNRKDHSTVVHACSQLQKQLPLSPPLRADIDAIRATLRASNSAA
jgi:chromosomal replication initiator protein